MKKLWWIPIENIDERYSAQWNRWFPKIFDRCGINWQGVYGEELGSGISVGAFLDIYNTNYYKASQLMKLVAALKDGEIRHGDVLFFADLWFPGIEMLAYIRDASQVDFKIVGYLHAGTYHYEDYLQQCGMERWGRDIEMGWLRFIDRVYLGSEHHANILQQKRSLPPTQRRVVGLPIDYEEIKQQVQVSPKPEVPIFVFPHRLTREKRPEIFDLVCKLLQQQGVIFNAVKTKEVCKTKEEYYTLLQQSTVSFSCSVEETFGIAMVESMILGVPAVCPDAFAYKETIPDRYRYNSINQAVDMCAWLLKHPTEVSIFEMELYYKQYFPTPIKNIILDLKELEWL